MSKRVRSSNDLLSLGTTARGDIGVEEVMAAADLGSSTGWAQTLELRRQQLGCDESRGGRGGAGIRDGLGKLEQRSSTVE
ncbi:hypothetical protein M0R45_019144 [Rubus argutus]|uniref:Uncharacterized protein n=1 Tax=Rubus argutus TaxID=59490 RepID=A0AAW1X7A3_RUBAR